MTIAAGNRFNWRALRTSVRPFKLHWFSAVGSTNNQAALLRRREELFAPAIVLTGRQTRGRGRGVNAWWSGPGSLTVTFVFPVSEQRQAHHVPLLAGLAVRRAAAALSHSDRIALKWPNDLLVGDRKLAGLLCERLEGVDLIGLGLNVNRDADVPDGLKSKCVWLNEITGGLLDKTNVLSTIATMMHEQITRGAEQPFAAALKEYERHDALRGRDVVIADPSLAQPITGVSQGLDSDGRLLVRSLATLHHIVAGHVQAY